MANISAFQRTITDFNKLQEVCSNISFDVLEQGLSNLSSIISERRKSEENKTKKISAVLDQLKREGISLNDLIDSSDEAPKRASRGGRPALYQYSAPNGKIKQWTGQGRKPKPIQDALDAGTATLDDFLINKPQQ
ncbi:MAG: H-NS histone family protein [Succinivibrionaceae bacterium]|nr:H-NS histone family protein [Succinivibrionaceae bacterium]